MCGEPGRGSRREKPEKREEGGRQAGRHQESDFSKVLPVRAGSCSDLHLNYRLPNATPYFPPLFQKLGLTLNTVHSSSAAQNLHVLSLHSLLGNKQTTKREHKIVSRGNNNQSRSSLSLKKVTSAATCYQSKISTLALKEGIEFQSVFDCGICNQHWISYNRTFLISKEDILKYKSYDLSSLETHSPKRKIHGTSRVRNHLRQG